MILIVTPCGGTKAHAKEMEEDHEPECGYREVSCLHSGMVYGVGFIMV